MAKDKVQGAVTDAELANLSDEEREALEDEGSDVDTLQQLADEGADAGKDKGKNKAEAGEEDAEEGDKKKGDKKAGAEDADADDADDEDTDAGEKGAKGKEGADADDKGDGKAKEAKEAKDAGADAGEAAGEGEEDEDEDEDDARRLPRYTAPAVEKYEDKIAALDARRADAEAKFKAGDLELDALRAEDRKIEAELRALNEAKLKHDISVEQNAQADKQEWEDAIARFIKRAKRADDVDYKGNRTLNAALDQVVKDLGNAKDKDGNFLHGDKPGRWFLREAHKQVMKDIGRGKPAADTGDAETPEEKKARAKAAADGRKTDPKKLPKTLARVPAADADDAGGDPEFAGLEGLEGLDLEDAVARMTPAQQDKWARSTGAV